MSLNLPKPIAAYLAAENGDDTEVLAQCFANDAIIRDEGRKIAGLAVIKEWKAESKKKYQHTVEPLSFVQKEGKTVVMARVAGKFTGSPLDLQFVFSIKDGKIASLEVN